jgi:hypothetical protein
VAVSRRLSPRVARAAIDAGVEKLFEEGLVRFAAEWEGLRIYALRIGHVRPAGSDSPYAPAEAAVKRRDLERGSDEYERLVDGTRGI